jgi:hypothetical protein
MICNARNLVTTITESQSISERCSFFIVVGVGCPHTWSTIVHDWFISLMKEVGLQSEVELCNYKGGWQGSILGVDWRHGLYNWGSLGTNY